MTRIFEFLVAVSMVIVLAVVIALALPTHASASRSIEVSHNIREVYDILANYRRFPDYGVLRAYDAKTQFEFSGPAYGVGAKVSWKSSNPKVGTGELTMWQLEPAASAVFLKGTATIVWKLHNSWSGHNKRIVFEINRSGKDQRLVKIVARYRVDYGWNLFDRYSRLFIHGAPDHFLEYTLTNLQNVLAVIPNLAYGQLHPTLVDTPKQPIVYVSESVKNTHNDISVAIDSAMQTLHVALKKLGVAAAGPRTVITRRWSRNTYTFDVAVPISSTKLKVAGQDYDLTQPGSPTSAVVVQTSKPSGSTPAGTTQTLSKQPAVQTPPTVIEEKPGDWEVKGQLIISNKVRARMAFGGRALMAVLDGSSAQSYAIHKGLEAYAATHGYSNNPELLPIYDVQSQAPNPRNLTPNNPSGVQYKVYLPVIAAPLMTPWQAAQVAPAGVSSTLTPASSASVSAPAVSSSTATPAQVTTSAG